MKNITTNKTSTALLIHILVWSVGALFFFYQAFFSAAEMTYHFWIKQSFAFASLVFLFYLNAALLVPRFLFRKHMVTYVAIIVFLVIGTTVINGLVERKLSSLEQAEIPFNSLRRAPGSFILRHPPHAVFVSSLRPGTRDIFLFVITSLVIGISTAITVIQKWQKDNQRREELEKDKVSSELSFLKAQINPHFFFNTLNNIYALTTLDPKMAGEAIHRLSKMMRYLLYDTQQSDSFLSQEIAFIKNYIGLMQLRLTDVVKINFTSPSQLLEVPIAPMIFLPFVENAFKHGVSAMEKSHISVHIWQNAGSVGLQVRNSILKDNSVSLDTGSGIGLVNTRRRLDLLYPQKYQLDIQETESEYIVHLVLHLS